jgi:hypothetical protein
VCLLLATCDRYVACGFSSLYVSLYPCVYLSGESYCCEDNSFSSNQEIPVLYGTCTVFTIYNTQEKLKILRSLKSGKTDFKNFNVILRT